MFYSNKNCSKKFESKSDLKKTFQTSSKTRHATEFSGDNTLRSPNKLKKTQPIFCNRNLYKDLLSEQDIIDIEKPMAQEDFENDNNFLKQFYEVIYNWGNNVGEKMYRKGLVSHEQKKIKFDELKKYENNNFKSKVTHRPNLNSQGHGSVYRSTGCLKTRSVLKETDFLDKLLSSRRERIRYASKSVEKQKMEECTFQPKIDRVSREIARKVSSSPSFYRTTANNFSTRFEDDEESLKSPRKENRFEKLYQNSKNKTKRMSLYAEK